MGSLLDFRLEWREANDLDLNEQFAWSGSWGWSFVNHEVGMLLFDPSCLVAHSVPRYEFEAEGERCCCWFVEEDILPPGWRILIAKEMALL